MRQYPLIGTLDIAAFNVDPKTVPSTLKTIDDLIDPNYFHKIPEQVIAYGFFDVTDLGKSAKIRTYLAMTGIETNYELILKAPRRASKEPDLAYFKNYTLLLKDTLTRGMSGSPLFGKFIINNKPQYRFLGINYANIAGINKGLCLKASRVIGYIHFRYSKR
jgi:hypothetical protein